MNIDREQLINLLVERTPRGKEEIERQFDEMIAEITDLTAEGKPYTIEGFGAFFLEDGILSFEPAEELQTEINYKYVGMKPVEIVKPNRDMPETDAKSPVEAPKEYEPSQPEAPREQPPEPAPGAEKERDMDFSDEDRIADIWGIPSASELDERARQRENQSKQAQDREANDSETEETEETDERGSSSEAGEKERAETSKPEEPETTGKDFYFEEKGLEEEGEEPVTEAEASEKEEPGEKESSPETEEPFDFDLPADEERETTEVEEAPTEPEVEAETEDEPGDETAEVAEENPFEPDEELEKIFEIDEEEQQPAEQKTASKQKSAPGRPRKKIKKRNDYTIAVLFAIFSVIVAAGVVYWAAMSPKQQPVSETAQSQPAAGDNGGDFSDGDVQSAAEQGPADEGPAEEAVTDPVKTAAAAQAGTGDTRESGPEETNTASGDIYGLYGKARTAANDGYTIVIYSLKNGANANNIKGQMEAENYRALVKKTTRSNGETYWRVSIGQFKTIGDAQEAAKDLDQPYRDHHFIHRI